MNKNDRTEAAKHLLDGIGGVRADYVSDAEIQKDELIEKKEVRSGNRLTEGLIAAAAILIIGGIIWGLWHAPLTCIGHNFGTDYPGFPFLGILMMCAFCILMGVILTFLTEMSGSVWPAAIMHAVTNAYPSALIGFMNDTGVDPVKALWVNWGGMMIALIAVVIVCIFIWRKNKKKYIDEIS